MTRHERLLENYEDAYFALLMEDVAQMENARLDRFNTELQNDPHAAVPEELTKRCLKTINAHFSNMRRSSSLRIVKKAINLAAILIAISTLLFTSAFAISDEFRTATLNLVITANEKYTQLKMKQEDPPQESGNTMVTDSNKFFKNIRLTWLPDGYEYLSGEYDYQAIFATVYKGNIIKNLIMDCQSYTKYRPNETTGGIFVSWRRKEELPTGA